MVKMRAFMVTIIACSAVAGNPPDDPKKRYGFKQARITMEKKVINPSFETTIMDTLFVDNWGMLEVRVTHEVRTIRMLDNMKEESRSVAIIDGDIITSYDPIERTGTRIKNPAAGLANMSKERQEQFAEGITDAFKATTEELPPETVAGKPCTVTKTTTGMQGMSTETTAWLWKGFNLRVVNKGMGSDITENALSVDEGIGVSPELLIIPSDIVIKDMTK